MVVYLKPKKSPDPEPVANATVANNNNNNNVSQASDANDDIARAEIRTLRQSAVTMSAGQKEGATQIIKDWLEDSPSDNNEETNSDDKEE